MITKLENELGLAVKACRSHIALYGIEKNDHVLIAANKAHKYAHGIISMEYLKVNEQGDAVLVRVAALDIKEVYNFGPITS